MNPNGTQDRQLLEKIDRLQAGHPSGIPLLDDLAQTVPQPRPDFQHQLEERLAARLQSRPAAAEGGEPMTTLSTQPTRNLAAPLTLAAALLIMALVGSILLAGRGKPSTAGQLVAPPDASSSLSAAQASTAVPLIRIVVARQNLPAGFHFPDTLEKLADYVDYAPWPVEAAPFAALSEDDGGLEKLLGQYLRTEIFREQPILDTFLLDAASSLPAVSVGTVLPRNRVAVSIPISAIQSVQYALQQGDDVDVVAGMMFYDENLVFQSITPPASGTLPAPQMVMQRLIQDALVVHIGNVPQPDSAVTQPTPVEAAEQVVTLAVSPDEATVLQWAIEAHISLMLIPTTPENLRPVVIARQFLARGAKISADSVALAYWPVDLVPDGALTDASGLTDQYVQNPVEAGQPLMSANVSDKSFWSGGMTPFGTVGFDLLRTAISGMPADLKRGDTVDLTVSFLYREWHNEPQGIWPPANTSLPASGYVVRKTLFKGLYVVAVDDQAVSIYWTLDDIAAFRWLTDTNADHPLALTLTHTNAPNVDFHIENLPDGKLAVTLPLTAVQQDTTYTGQIQIVGSLTFIDSPPSPDVPDQLQTEPVTEIIVPEAELTGRVSSSGADTADGLRLIIAPEDLPALQWALQAGIPLTFVPS